MVSMAPSKQQIYHILISLLICNTFFSNVLTDVALEVPRTIPECYAKDGDIILGHLLPIRTRGAGHVCIKELHSDYIMQYVEAFVYAIQKINLNHNILSNISLGFVILDDCASTLQSLGKALFFTPLKGYDAPITDTICSRGLRHFKVAGLVGPDTSGQSVLVGSLFSVFQIPVLSEFATANELSDKSRFEYLSRMVSPDRFQAQAMLDILSHFSWIYVSLLYTEGSYGESGAKEIENGIKELDICLAVSKKIPSDATKEDYNDIIQNIYKYAKAKVVLMFVSYEDGKNIFESVEDAGLTGHFLWLGSDTFSYYDFGPGSNGSLSLNPIFGHAPDFIEHYLKLTPANNADNPWFPELWEERLQCTWNTSWGNKSCYLYEDMPLTNQPLARGMTLSIDSVNVFSYALDQMIKDNCPLAFRNQSLLDNCISGSVLLKYLRNVSFEGISGKVQFNKQGDRRGHFEIMQYLYTDIGGKHTVALWDGERGKVYVDNERMDWTAYQGVNVKGSDAEVPLEAVCSKPCEWREARIQLDVQCCWLCQKCRPNEYLATNATHCIMCPQTTWPNEHDDSTPCLNIPPTFLRWVDPVGIGLIILSIIGVFGCSAVSIVFVQQRNTKLIKASSRQLTTVILFGIILAFSFVFAFLAKPSLNPCIISRYGFHLSVCLIYSPLLVKTNRIYRIFKIGKHGNKTMTFISNRSQLIITGTLIVTQVNTSL